jgi:hypothetical protein
MRLLHILKRPPSHAGGRRRRERDEARKKLVDAARKLGPFEDTLDIDQITRPELATAAIKSTRTIGDWLKRAEWELDDLRAYMRQYHMRDDV